MPIKVNAPADCSGCTACASVCPHRAIAMRADEKGFLYPEVDAARCTGCGLCEAACPFHEHYGRYGNYDRPRYYAMRCLDRGQLAKSQSGGAFYLLSEAVLAKGGVVYGASFGDAFRVEHHRAQTADVRDRMRGSKYVQSDLTGVFAQVKADIRGGRKVLFSGTPCQVAGLWAFFGRRQPDGLVTVDLLCHGVASPLFWHKYLIMIEAMKGHDITEVRMRDKAYGWLSSDETYVFANGRRLHKNTFYSLYYNGFISRESCFRCPFANERRIGDLSIGDYHGWNQGHDRFTDNTGMSLVLVNSDKGQVLLDEVRKGKDVFCEPTDINPADHVALSRPAEKSDRYDDFWRDFLRRGAKYVCKRYGDMGWHTQMNIYFSRILKI